MLYAGIQLPQELQVTCISGMTTWPPKANMTVPRELKVPKVRSATLPERLP